MQRNAAGDGATRGDSHGGLAEMGKDPDDVQLRSYHGSLTPSREVRDAEIAGALLGSFEDFSEL